MEWKGIEEALPRLLGELKESTAFSRDDLGECPKKGVYVFYENDAPIYVGRSNRMKERIQEHGRPSGTHYSASFAFKMARDRKKEWKRSGLSRRELSNEPGFQKWFSKMKKKVSDFEVRFIELTDDAIQAIFEIYASLELDTKYNDWRTT